MLRTGLLAAFVVAGCANASSRGQDDAGLDPMRPDAAVEEIADAPSPIDAAVEVDARSIDAPPPDAAPDAAVLPPDACVPTQNERLTNESFDASPKGTGWQETRVTPTVELITDEDGLTEHSGPYKVWLGGISGQDVGRASITDIVRQTITFPPTATNITLTGYYAVATQETGPTAFDTAAIAIVSETDALIETALTLNNTQTTSTWVPFTKVFTQNLAGRTVKLRLTSSHDETLITSFWFDSFSLEATYCP